MYLSSLEKEELEDMRNELIFIKNIFIKQEEEEEKMGDAVDRIGGGGGGGEVKGKSDFFHSEDISDFAFLEICFFNSITQRPRGSGSVSTVVTRHLSDHSYSSHRFTIDL